MAKQNALPKEGSMPEVAATNVMKVVRGLAADKRQLQFNHIIHERTRLAIVSALAAKEPQTFKELKEILNLSDGNLSVHARKLEEARYVSSRKFFEGRMPKTEYRLTKTGRRALEHYLDHMEALIKAVRNP